MVVVNLGATAEEVTLAGVTGEVVLTAGGARPGSVFGGTVVLAAGAVIVIAAPSPSGGRSSSH